jgi:hypothetical protein
MSDFRFSCPFCQQHLACENGNRGTTILCPACKAEIKVPGLPGLAIHIPTSGHGVGNYSPPVPPGRAPNR